MSQPARRARTAVDQDASLASRIDEVLSCQRRDRVVTFLHRGEHVALELTGDALRERVVRLAAGLSLHIPTGQSALLVMPAGPDFLVTLLACLYAGIVAIPLPIPGPGSRGDRLDLVVANAGATAILCTTSSAVTVREYFGRRATHASAPAIIAVDDPELGRGVRFINSACDGLARGPHERVIVQYTSGSTRAPRGVALSSRNVASNATLVSRCWDRGAADVAVNWLPHFHDMGLMGGLLYPLLWGARSVQMAPLAFVQKPLRWLRALTQFRGTLSGAPAFAFALCLEAARTHDFGDLDLSSWQVAYCGGEPVPSKLLHEFRARFARVGLQRGAVHACYGLAEATLLVAGQREQSEASDSAPSDDTGVTPCRLSRGMRETLRIVDPQTFQVMPDGQEGEIWVSGPSVASVPLEQLSASSSPVGYLRTGDLGSIRPEGLYITGRIKDVLIAQGRNVAAIDIEWLAAEQHPALNPLAAAAFALDPKLSADAALLIELTKPHATLDVGSTGERIRRAASAEYGVDLRMIKFLSRGTLERTTSGKIRRQTIAERVRGGHCYQEVGA